MSARRAHISLLLFLVSFVVVPAASQTRSQQIKTMSSRELLTCLEVNPNCGVESYDALDELTRRRQVSFLIRAFRNSKDGHQQELLVAALSHIRDPRVSRFMREIASEWMDEQDWLAWQYLAERGDRKALAMLNQNCGKYGISSDAWSDTLVLFGKYRFRPAIPCLISWVNAMNLTPADAAYKSLRILFPGSPELKSPEEAEVYFTNRAKKEAGSRKVAAKRP
jgi:hypothetical protein